MKKLVATVMALVMLFTGATSVMANNKSELRKAVDKVVGTPYKYGGTTTAGFDCSGFVRHIFNQFDVSLPRTSRAQATVGVKVDKADLREGDLVFFNTSGKGISHAGIYLGDGLFAHSSSSKGVIIQKMSDSYYAKRYVTARRVFAGDKYPFGEDNEEPAVEETEE